MKEAAEKGGVLGRGLCVESGHALHETKHSAWLRSKLWQKQRPTLLPLLSLLTLLHGGCVMRKQSSGKPLGSDGGCAVTVKRIL